MAACYHKKETLEYLLEEKADVASQDSLGRTALHMLAVDEFNEPICQQLLVSGSPIAAKDSEGATPLHLATGANRSDAVTYLLKMQAPLSAVDSKGRSVLHVSARFGTTALFAQLLEARADPSTHDAHGCSVAAVAAEYDRGETLRLLQSRGTELEPSADKAFRAWVKNARVALHSLTTSELNGAEGSITARGESGRLAVQLDGDAGTKSFKRSNLALTAVSCFVGDRVLLRNSAGKYEGNDGVVLCRDDEKRWIVRVSGDRVDGETLEPIDAEDLAPLLC